MTNLTSESFSMSGRKVPWIRHTYEMRSITPIPRQSACCVVGTSLKGRTPHCHNHTAMLPPLAAISRGQEFLCRGFPVVGIVLWEESNQRTKYWTPTKINQQQRLCEVFGIYMFFFVFIMSSMKTIAEASQLGFTFHDCFMKPYKQDQLW